MSVYFVKLDKIKMLLLPDTKSVEWLLWHVPASLLLVRSVDIKLRSSSAVIKCCHHIVYLKHVCSCTAMGRG